MAGRLSAALLLALLIAACSDPDPELIRVALPKAPTSLDPRIASDAVSERINTLLYQPLVELDDRQRPVPAMARWHGQGDTYEFVLRPDRRTFVSGRLPLAADVVATYRAVLDPGTGSPHRGALAHIERIDAAGDDRVRVRLSRPDPRLPEKMRIGILPAGVPAGESGHMDGSGAFALAGGDIDRGLRLRRREDGREFLLEAVPDPTMRLLKLLRGEVHLLQNDLPAEMYRYARAEPGVQQRDAAGITFSYLGFNLADPVTGDPRVRRAIAHAVDRRAIIDHLFLGLAQEAQSLLRPGHWAAHADLPVYKYDPAAARRLLAAAGFGEHRPLELEYKTSTDPFRLRIAAALQAQLAEVGIRLRIRSADWGTFFGDIKAGRFQLYSLSWVGITSPDILRHVYHSASIPPRGANRGRYRSVDVDRLIEAGDRAADAEAARFYRAVQARVHRDLVYVPLWYESNVALFDERIAGYRPDAEGSYRALEQVDWRDDG